MQAKIVKISLLVCDGCLKIETPNHLVGEIVDILEYEDAGYDSEYPTGEERAHFIFKRSNGDVGNEDCAMFRKLDGTRFFWNDIKDLPRNFN